MSLCTGAGCSSDWVDSHGRDCPLSLEEVDDSRDEELLVFLGLAYRKRDADALIRAKARASMADLNPLSKPAVELADRMLRDLYENAQERIKVQREAVASTYLKYTSGLILLADLISSLDAIVESED